MEIDHIGLPPSGMLDSGSSTPAAKGGKKAQAGGANSNDGPDQQEEGEEQKLIRALKELDRLHTKLIDLRSTIPKMMQPVNEPAAYPGPEELFKDFMTRTVKATEDVVDFTNAMVGNRWVFEQANASRGADPSNIKRWKFSASQPVYLTAEEKAKANGAGADAAAAARRKSEAAAKEDVEMGDAAGNAEEEKDSSVVIEEFRKEHPEGDVTITEQDGEIKITLPKEVGLTFTIKRPKSNEKQRWLVNMPQTSHLHISIFRSITTRPNPQNLKLLLEMMLAYSTIYSQKCEKCDNLTSLPNAALPVIRRLIKNVRVERIEKKKDASAEKQESKAKPVKGKENGTKGKKEDDNKKDSKDKKGKQGSKESSADSKPDEPNDAIDIKKDEAPGEDDDFEEKEVVEEKWVAYHETCLQ